ncbi:MAG: hypothetical protein IJ300_01505 [Clostridia bacterium]|nr:hypothetical protein [Clostridia bacterium]
MAYVIGSQKGKDIAKNMTVGSTYKASDGSTWTKKSDGSVSVTTSKGETFNNAYSPTSSGGSSVSSKSGSSYKGSSGSSNKNSQYTAPNLGNTWNANTDYQAIINNAVANGDYVTAAKAEQLRNQKITATGSNYNTTNMYTGRLNNVDYGTMGQQLMANNASWQDVLDIYNSRYNKAVSTEGLQKYANDEIQQMMWQYIQDNMQLSSQQEAQDQYNEWVQEYEQNNPKEEYQSKYDTQIDALLNEILNRDDFSYDAMNDPLYQQYAKMYQREGDRAMKETMAEAAAGAGGMNTYAITAAQQANSYYNSQLNDKIPELYQLAYEMYLNDKESKVQDLGILQNMDATQYNRYRDTINDYYADKNFAYGAYQDAIQQGNWQTNYNYNSALDNRTFNYNDYWANKEFDYNDYWANKEYTDNRADIEYERNQAEEEEAQAKIDWLIKNGVTTIDAETIEKAGLDEATVKMMIANYQKQNAKSSGSGGSGGGSRRNSGGGGDDYTGDGGGDGDTGGDDDATNDISWHKGLSDLGLPLAYSPDVITDLAEAGGIYESGGKLKWADGWNSVNFKARLQGSNINTGNYIW